MKGPLHAGGRRRPSGAAATAAIVGAAERGLPQHGAYMGVLREAMATDEVDPAGVYFGTSTGQLFASRDEGEHWSADRRLPAADLVGRDAVIDRLSAAAMATVNLPRSLVALFRQPPRHLDMAAPTLGEPVTRARRTLAGHARPRLRAGSALREHINVFVDGHRERDLGAPLTDASVVHIIPAVAGG